MPMPPDDGRAAPPPLAFRLAAVGCGVIAAVVVGIVAARMAGIDLGRGFERVRQAGEPAPTLAPSGYMTADPIRGHRHVPGAVGNLRTDEFDATYSIDARGARDIPAHRDAPAGRPVVEIFGDSFTFGHGVADDVPYPAVLQRDHWPYMDVRNRGVNGYGTMQAMAWLDEIAPSEPGLERVLYGWLDFHISRNGPDPSWLELVERSHQRLPLYRVKGGRPEFDRLIGLADALPAGDPALIDIEWANTEAAVRQMDRVTRAAGATFHVVLLPLRYPDGAAANVARMRRLLADSGVRSIDLTDMNGATDDALYFPVDGHPKAEWHRRVAAGIAAGIAAGVGGSGGAADRNRP